MIVEDIYEIENKPETLDWINNENSDSISSEKNTQNSEDISSDSASDKLKDSSDISSSEERSRPNSFKKKGKNESPNIMDESNRSIDSGNSLPKMSSLYMLSSVIMKIVDIWILQENLDLHINKKSVYRRLKGFLKLDKNIENNFHLKRKLLEFILTCFSVRGFSPALK